MSNFMTNAGDVIVDLGDGRWQGEGQIWGDGDQSQAEAFFNSLIPPPDRPAPTIAEQAMAIPSIAAWKIQVVLDQHPSPVNAGKTLLDDANALIATQPRAVQIAWTNGADVAYASPTLAALRAAIGITSDDAFDAMWVSAAAVAL